MYKSHEIELIGFEESNVWAGVEGPTLSVGEGEEECWEGS